jgi:hypothetical protein
MKILILLAPSLLPTPVFAADSDAAVGAAGGGLAGLFGLITILGIVYLIVSFLLPFFVWGCLNKLTDIRDDIRGLRKELAAGKAPEIGNERLRNLAALVEENEKATEQEWRRAREDFTLPPT